MSQFKTRAEIGTANEFIQYEELLRSGDLPSGTGVNRALQRLAENDNALLDSLQSARMPAQLYDGGTITFSAGTLSFTGDLSIMVFSELGGAYTNKVAAGSVVGIATGDLLYAKLDRTVDLALVTLAKSTIPAFMALITGASDRLDYLPIAIKGANGITLCNGQRIRDGESLSNSLFTDTQYGQQAELTPLHNDVVENLNIFLRGGGTLHWDSAASTFTVSANLYIEFPSSAGDNFIAAGPYAIPLGSSLYVVLSRAPGSSLDRSASAFVAATGSVPVGDDNFVVATHASDGRLYISDGTAISNGESLLLGGVRQGVQFFVAATGTGTQVLDLQTYVGGATYSVGSGELMVYRNGVKAKRSQAYWEGAYPAGTLVGAISASDDYIEEDSNGVPSPLDGHRIIWIRDLLGAAEAVVRDPPVNDPPATWPSANDDLELFIGTQAQAPTITVPNGVYGFDLVWSQSPSTIRTKGGVLVYGSSQYVSDGSSPLEIVLDGTATPPAVMPAETIAAGWNYIYLGPGVSGGVPDIRISGVAPNDVGGGAGKHPSDARYRFLTSVHLQTLSSCRSFVKEGSWVRMDPNAFEDISAAFPGTVITNAFEQVDVSTFLPSTAIAFKLYLDVATQAALAAGDSAVLTVLQEGFSWTAFSRRGIKAGNTPNIPFEVDVVAPVGLFRVKLDPAAILSVSSASIIGYSEGRFTSGTALGV